jgi:ferredoxin--NADP+ reductase/benzoate/toluate 1,2-dioxygenase reductase subunit
MDISIHSKYKVREVRNLTESTYVVRMNRYGMEFKPGQNLNLGLAGDTEKRDYSIYSGIDEDYLEILVKEVEDGLVSKQLKRLKPGDQLEVDGPFGFFTIKEKDLHNRKFLFIASGTGIAPFHSITRSHPDINYKLLHGIRYLKETYEKQDYPSDRYISCVSQEEGGDFKGRVTEYIRQNPLDKETLCYICGNVNMIYDVFDILKEQGVPSENLHAEVYF